MCICARICVIALLIASFNPFLEASDSIQSASEAQSGQQRRDDAMDREIERKMENERSRQRYVSLKQDSERLLELATELKQYVDKSGEHTLSMVSRWFAAIGFVGYSAGKQAALGAIHRRGCSAPIEQRRMGGFGLARRLSNSISQEGGLRGDGSCLRTRRRLRSSALRWLQETRVCLLRYQTTPDSGYQELAAKLPV